MHKRSNVIQKAEIITLRANTLKGVLRYNHICDYWVKMSTNTRGKPYR